ncbi:hypothetical protein BOTBODRAFT_172289 [Botryobasidium botryosum FD-172 SS1]|uniref:Uncharacterized protein n=1 Tax=Botryobasidium botryosum (strain FD-172 SS1) TaxID=930990 RepID=A0A067MR91_BOTB1|nr:hypothetical protein BOTBODRAFT_172289 [Botryobasidium botryosum FD-172 SS1]
MVVSIILYVPLFFILRGYIEVSPGARRWYRYKIKFVRRPIFTQRAGASTVSAGNLNSSLAIRLAATKMLWYPLANLLSVTKDIARWKFMADIDPNIPLKDVPFTAIAVAHTLYSMSGAVDVLLFYFTRPRILLFGEPVLERHGLGIVRAHPHLEFGDRDCEDGTCSSIISRIRLIADYEAAQV